MSGAGKVSTKLLKKRAKEKHAKCHIFVGMATKKANERKKSDKRQYKRKKTSDSDNQKHRKWRRGRNRRVRRKEKTEVEHALNNREEWGEQYQYKHRGEIKRSRKTIKEY